MPLFDGSNRPLETTSESEHLARDLQATTRLLSRLKVWLGGVTVTVGGILVGYQNWILVPRIKQEAERPLLEQQEMLRKTSQELTKSSQRELSSKQAQVAQLEKQVQTLEQELSGNQATIRETESKLRVALQKARELESSLRAAASPETSRALHEFCRAGNCSADSLQEIVRRSRRRSLSEAAPAPSPSGSPSAVVTGPGTDVGQ